jgi:hypothetical protein
MQNGRFQAGSAAGDHHVVVAQPVELLHAAEEPA